MSGGMPIWKVIFNVSEPKPEMLYEEVRAWTAWKAVEVAYKSLVADPEVGGMLTRHINKIEVLGGHAGQKNPLLDRLNTQEEVDKERRQR